MSLTNALENLRVVLVSTRNPLNIGAAARAMSNFGVLNLRVVSPYEVAFREARSAVGASAVLQSAEEFSSIADAVADCTLVVGTTAAQHRQMEHALHPLVEGARLLREKLAPARVALVFGSEKYGLTTEEMSHCHWLMRIPTREVHPSMNLGQAVAICLYEIARDEAAVAAPSKRKDASALELERITELLDEAMRESGYTAPRTTVSTHEKIRRLVHRLNLNHRDAEVFTGMLRKVLWKMRSANTEQK